MSVPESMTAIRMGLASLGTLRTANVGGGWWHAFYERPERTVRDHVAAGCFKARSEEIAVRFMWGKVKPLTAQRDLSTDK